METLESLKRRLRSTEDLQSVVRTMKSLAAVNIRQYEQAARALSDYFRTVETGLQVVVRNTPGSFVHARTAPMDRLLGVIFGTDQGMCGPLNEQIVSFAEERMDRSGVDPADRDLLVVGERADALVEAGRHDDRTVFNVPGSVSGITPVVQEMLMEIEAWDDPRRSGHVYLFFHRQTSGAASEPRELHLLPADREWLGRLQGRPWDSRSLPVFSMDPDRIFSDLIREYLFSGLYRAFVESAASENASRLAAMQGAEKNISEQLESLRSDYHRQRQMSITEELLDIVAGFEALESA